MSSGIRITFEKTETLADGCCGTSLVGRYQTNYVMRVSTDGPAGEAWEVRKRYTDFAALDAQLRKKFWYDRKLPPLPPKNAFAMQLDQRFIEARRVELNRYMSGLLEIKHVARSETLWAFLQEGKLEAGPATLATLRVPRSSTDRTDPKDLARVEAAIASGRPSVHAAIELLKSAAAGPAASSVTEGNGGVQNVRLKRDALLELHELLDRSAAEFAYMSTRLTEFESELAAKERMIAEFL